MGEELGEIYEENKKMRSQILDTQRRKRLMKKLEKIKLNRSRGNNSFIDLGAFYESKLRKLKTNNVSLAKALAEQRQVSQSWYDEVVALKEELHETREDLLRFQVNENGSHDDAIQAAAERRVKEIAEPLESAVKDCLENVFGMVDSMTKVKQLITSLFKASNEKLSNSRSSSRGSNGSRPPLSRTPKSPRKNVVHPMVEGHVLQPASIHIPRMSLEERRRYRLQERAEVREDAGMAVIGEHSISLAEEEASEETSQIEAQPSEETSQTEAETEEVQHPTDTNEVVSHSSESIAATTLLTEEPLPEPNNSNTEPKKVKRQRRVVDFEDPLEGSSWMHTKKRRGSRKKKSRVSSASITRSSNIHLVLESSSDSEEEVCQIIEKKNPKEALNEEKTTNLSPSLHDTSLPMLRLVRLEELDSQVSRRSKKKSNESQLSVNGNLEICEELRSVPLESFIINETLKSDSDLPQLQLSADDSDSVLDCGIATVSVATSATVAISQSKIATATTMATTTTAAAAAAAAASSNLKSNVSEQPCKDNHINVTCILESSMEMTQCLAKDLLRDIVHSSEMTQTVNCIATTHQESTVPDESQNKDTSVSNPEKERKKTNRFFKSSDKEEKPKAAKPTEKTPYDLSMMETSIVDPDILRKEKENIPPELEKIIDSGMTESSLKLRDVFIIIEDIMKTPSLAAELSLHSPNSINELKTNSAEVNSSKSVKSVPGKKKRRGTKDQDQSPVRKVSKKSKKIDFSQEKDASGPTSSSGDETWSPTVNSNVKGKRKTGSKKKNPTSRKSKLTLSKANSHDKPNGELCPALVNSVDTLSDKEKKSSRQRPLKEPVLSGTHLGSNGISESDNKQDENVNNDNPILIEKKVAHESESTEMGEELLVTDPLLDEIYKEVTSLLKKKRENTKDDGEEFDPLLFSPKISEQIPDLPDLTALKNESDEPEIIAVVKSSESLLASDELPFSANSLEELVKARPRRAATKIRSFKEPSLNCKLRQEINGKKIQAKPKKNFSVKSTLLKS